MTRTPAKRNHDRRDLGFTLIEILVVVVIIGVLAAIAIPVFLNQRKKAVDAELKSDMRNVAMSVETLVDDHPETQILMILGGAGFEVDWAPFPGRVDWLGDPTARDTLDVKIDEGTYLFGKWARTRGVHSGGLCMVAAARGGTYQRVQSSVTFWEDRASDAGQYYWDSLDGGFAKHPTARCATVFNGAY